jgi:hypothetical protein
MLKKTVVPRIIHFLINGFDLCRQLFDTSFLNSLSLLKQDIQAMFILIIECRKRLHIDRMSVSSQIAEILIRYYSHCNCTCERVWLLQHCVSS